MLAAQRTSLINRGMAQLSAFFAADVRMTGSATVIACVGGNLRSSGLSLMDRGAGAEETHSVMFRVAKSAFDERPALGATFEWRRDGETPWRETLRIARVDDPAGMDQYFITGEQI